MLQEINELVNNDWALDVIDGKIDVHKSKPNTPVYYKFTQKEAQEMSAVLGQIYRIAHGITCACGDKYRIKKREDRIATDLVIGAQ